MKRERKRAERERIEIKEKNKNIDKQNRNRKRKKRFGGKLCNFIYNFRILIDVGLCICLYDILEIGESHIMPGL